MLDWQGYLVAFAEKIIHACARRANLLLYRVIAVAFHFVPVRRGRMFFMAWHGARYGCNPKAVSEYLLSVGERDLVWYCLDPNQIADPRIKCVSSLGIKYLYYISTAEVVYNNVRLSKEEMYWKKKAQIYVQTFHGTPIKRIERDVENELPRGYVENAKKDSRITSLMVAGNLFAAKVVAKSFWYSGPVLTCGLPRNDVLFGADPSLYKKIVFGDASPMYRYALYCPTFRNNGRLDVFDIDVDGVISALSERFGGEWLLVVRMHPNVIRLKGWENAVGLEKRGVLNYSDYPDIQPLLAASDVLITDCSSSIFDYSIMRRPAFIIMPDWEEYDRGFYFRLQELPYPFADSSTSLLKNIETFDDLRYREQLEAFLTKQIGDQECGNSCKEVVNYVRKLRLA